ncbi:MAG: N-6 DNA methylase [bacterium]|nr:N-6 DNA methylase [bacterium]
MSSLAKEYISGLSQLEMFNADANSVGLIHISELKNPNINYHQRLCLEKAKKNGVDAVYFRNYSDNTRPSKPQLYIFDFTKGEKDIVEIHKNVWSSSEVRLYLIITKSEIKLFNSSKPVRQNKSGELYVSPFDILKIAGDAKERYEEYSGKKFDNGTFWEKTQIDFGYSETAYEKLITELKNARNYFLKKINIDKVIASKLLVLGILVKYLEERIDIDEKGKETRVFASDFFNQKKFGFSANFIETIKNGFALDLFDHLSRHFNGMIFHLPEEYKEQIRKIDLSPLAHFLSGIIDNKQFVFWKLYSFNHLPVELISSIYEVFLEADKNSGIAYTPSYLVNFMIDESMPINEPKENFKILDPACGSGIFLVSAFKRIIDWWRISVHQKTGKWIIPGKEHLHQLKKLLKKNIYGLDIEDEAVDLAIFSLSLTLCDMLSPTVIWENLRFDDLSNNIVKSDFFKWYSKDKREKFDLVVGNPPFIEYGFRFPEINSLTKSLELKEQVPNNQSSLLFSLLGIKLVKKTNGLLAFILPSGPLLYNNSKKPVNFRKWLFSEYNIPQIIDFTYLSNLLFKNKGNKKNVAVSAFFLENKLPDEKPIYHITVKKLKSAKERQYFEIDHYDFHKVSKTDALNNIFVWKSNLLGGGRLVPFIKKLSDFPTLKDFLNNRKNKGWIYGDGFIKGKPDDELVSTDFEKKKGGYTKAPYLTGLEYFEPEDFSENGIRKTQKINSLYFQWPRSKEIYQSPLLLIKKNIGEKSIPIYFSDKQLGYKNEVIGIHCPSKDKAILKSIYQRIKNNSLYRFYILATSSRSGVSRSTQTTLQNDILGIPFPENKKDIELTEFDKVLLDDTLMYGLEFLGKETNIKSLEVASNNKLIDFGNIFCKVLNSLFETETKKYLQDKIYSAESFICTTFHYSAENNTSPIITSDKQLEKHIAQLVYQKMGVNYRINRVVKVYDGDYIYLLKPKELRYWLKSAALRDADETIVDLYKAGY